MLNFCDFIQVYVFTTNHHLNITKKIISFRVLSNNLCILRLSHLRLGLGQTHGSRTPAMDPFS